MSDAHSRIFKVKTDFIPPSENNIRVIRVVKGRPAGMAWTAEAKGFKKKFKKHIQDTSALKAAVFSAAHTEDSVYDLFIKIGMPLLNKTYGLKNGAKYRYKRTDIANRRKLLEDALSEVLSIDDCLFFSVHMEKTHSEEPFLYISLAETDPLDYGVV